MWRRKRFAGHWGRSWSMENSTNHDAYKRKQLSLLPWQKRTVRNAF
jgi:hypothetical protein